MNSNNFYILIQENSSHSPNTQFRHFGLSNEPTYVEN